MVSLGCNQVVILYRKIFIINTMFMMMKHETREIKSNIQFLNNLFKQITGF